MGYFPAIIRVRPVAGSTPPTYEVAEIINLQACLLYTSDAADDLLCVDLGGRRYIKKKKKKTAKKNTKKKK